MIKAPERIPAWARTLPWDIITDQAARVGVESALIAAVIYRESDGIAGKTRFEPNYPWLLTPEIFAKGLGVDTKTETAMQRLSWGLMQIMGATAREVGFRGYFPELCARPALGVHYGAQFLKRKLAQSGGALEPALSAYNAGAPRCNMECTIAGNSFNNQAYVDKVMGWYRELCG